MSNITLEQAQQLIAAQGLRIIQHEDGQFSLAPIDSAPVPQTGVQVPEGVQQTPVESGPHLDAAPIQVPVQQFQQPQYTPAYAQAPQRQVSTSMKCQGGSTYDLLDAFRACGRAVNNGQDIHHGE